jgi:hypothetical protein
MLRRYQCFDILAVGKRRVAFGARSAAQTHGNVTWHGSRAAHDGKRRASKRIVNPGRRVGISGRHRTAPQLQQIVRTVTGIAHDFGRP